MLDGAWWREAEPVLELRPAYKAWHAIGVLVADSFQDREFLGIASAFLAKGGKTLCVG